MQYHVSGLAANCMERQVQQQYYLEDKTRGINDCKVWAVCVPAGQHVHQTGQKMFTVSRQLATCGLLCTHHNWL